MASSHPGFTPVPAKPKPEIGSENWVKAQIAAKLPPEEIDRPRG